MTTPGCLIVPIMMAVAPGPTPTPTPTPTPPPPTPTPTPTPTPPPLSCIVQVLPAGTNYQVNGTPYDFTVGIYAVGGVGPFTYNFGGGFGTLISGSLNPPPTSAVSVYITLETVGTNATQDCIQGGSVLDSIGQFAASSGSATVIFNPTGHM